MSEGDGECKRHHHKCVTALFSLSAKEFENIAVNML